MDANIFTWNPVAITGLAATALAWTLAAVLWRSHSHQRVCRRLILLLVAEGAAVATSGTTLGLLLAPGAFSWLGYTHCAADILLLALYPPFIVHALELPWLAPLRRPAFDRVLLVAALLAIGALVAWPDAFFVIADGAVVERAGWRIVGGALALMFFAGFVLAWLAWRAACCDLNRQQAGWFAVAFGLRDLVWGGAYLLVATVGVGSLIAGQWGVLLHAYAGVILVYVPLLVYAILKTRLLDLDLRVKLTLSRGTVAAVFLAVFFLVSELAALVLSDWLGGVVGLVAAAVLIFFIAPLQGIADRFADHAMPNVQATPEYLAYKKMQVYSAALESVLSDRRISGRERAMLERMRATLGIAYDDAQALERDICAALQARRPA